MLVLWALLLGCEEPVSEPTTPELPSEATFGWSRSYSGPSRQDEIDAVAAAPDGTVYISGKFEQTLTLQGHDEVLQSAGQADIPVAQYLSDGTIGWVKHFGSEGEDNVFDAVTDDAGNLYLSGYFGGTVEFDGVALSSTGADDLDMMVLSFDAQGVLRWAVRAGGPGTDGGNEINIAPDGSVVVLAGSDGSFQAGELRFEPSRGADAFVLRMDAETGAFLWGAQVAGDGMARAKCLSVAPDGRIYMGGDQGRGANRVVVGEQEQALASASGMDAFLVAFGEDGSLIWSRSWGGAGTDLCKGAVAVDDGVYITGEVDGTVVFDDDHVVQTDGPDLFVWKIDPQGDTMWLNAVSAPDELRGAEAVPHPDGGVVFGHRISGPTTVTSRGEDDVVIEAIGSAVSPVVLSYTVDGVLRFVLQPEAAPDGNISEFAVVGRRLYLDMPIFGGTYRVGDAVYESGPTKDALLVSVDL